MESTQSPQAPLIPRCSINGRWEHHSIFVDDIRIGTSTICNLLATHTHQSSKSNLRPTMIYDACILDMNICTNAEHMDGDGYKLDFGCQKRLGFPTKFLCCFKKTPQTPPYLQCLRTPWFFATTLMSPRNMRSARTRVKRSSSQRCQPLWWKKVPRRIGKMRCLRKVSYPKIFSPKKQSPSCYSEKKKHLALALWNFFVGYFLEAIWLFQLWCPPKLWEAAIPHHPWFVVVFFMARATLILIVFLSPPQKNPSSLGKLLKKTSNNPPTPPKKIPLLPGSLFFYPS